MNLTGDTLITLLQALQLVALAPCLFVIAFLLLTARDYRQTVVPCLYFLSLASCFMLPLLELWPQFVRHTPQGPLVQGGLLFIRSLLPAFSFLLIVQFARGTMPPLLYWSILALPIVGGSGVVYAASLADELCLVPFGCVDAYVVEGLYSTFSNALIFLLLVVLFAHARRVGGAPRLATHSRYGMVVALIALNLLVTGLELAHIGGWLPKVDAALLTTLVRVTFIFVVLILLFRVFDRQQPAVMVAPGAARKQHEQHKKDMEIIERFEALMQEQRIYQEMECSRETVAQLLEVHENTLSRVINQHYHQRFTDVVNQYRIKEAQRLLVANPRQAITDIAFEVGFSSIPSFNRVFKESSGFSPSEFRSTRLAAQQRR
jgi:AraC-like DNA-binding protein